MICAITAGIKKYKSIIKKAKKKHDKTLFLAKPKLRTKNIKNLVSKSLIDLCISHDEFMTVNNVLREYDDMKEVFIILLKAYENVKSKNPKVKKSKKGRKMFLSRYAVSGSKRSRFIK